jgi:heme a synthase
MNGELHCDVGQIFVVKRESNILYLLVWTRMNSLDVTHSSCAACSLVPMVVGAFRCACAHCKGMWKSVPRAAASAASLSTATMQSVWKQGYPLVWSSSLNPFAATGQWILGMGGLVVGMIHVGGVTRLTQSGLSMTTWSATGSLPPLTLPDWQAEFDRYKQFPEWQQRQSMTLSEFQYIYAWEYGHRMLGRVVGVAFVVPWLYFTVRKKIPLGYQGRMALLASMGATQGLVGWWMVQSGLTEDRRGDTKEIRVKPLRLAAHLSMAVATYGTLLWTGLDILKLPYSNAYAVDPALSSRDFLRHASRIRTGGLVVTALTATTIVSGALVAGNDAGRAYNTFPTMNGEWIPSEMFKLSPWHLNWIDNTATVQWNHRVLGTLTAASAVSLAAIGLRRPNLLTAQTRNGLVALGLATAAQFTLGVTTLLHYAPIGLAAAHQMGSIVVFTSGLYLAHSVRYCRPAALRAVANGTATVRAMAKEPAPIAK